jgi:hypothetical protein
VGVDDHDNRSLKIAGQTAHQGTNGLDPALRCANDDDIAGELHRRETP